jgi:hypothetical protein
MLAATWSPASDSFYRHPPEVRLSQPCVTLSIEVDVLFDPHKVVDAELMYLFYDILLAPKFRHHQLRSRKFSSVVPTSSERYHQNLANVKFSLHTISSMTFTIVEDVIVHLLEKLVHFPRRSFHCLPDVGIYPFKVALPHPNLI